MFTADDIKAIRSGTGGAGASSSASSQGFTAADIKKIRTQIGVENLKPAQVRQPYTAPKVAAPKISTPAAPQQTFAAPKTEATPQQKAVHERVLQIAANSNAPKSTVQELRSGRDFAVIPQAKPNAERDAYVADYMKKYPNDPFGKIGAELAYKADSNKALKFAQNLAEAANPLKNITDPVNYLDNQAKAKAAAENDALAKMAELEERAKTDPSVLTSKEYFDAASKVSRINYANQALQQVVPDDKNSFKSVGEILNKQSQQATNELLEGKTGLSKFATEAAISGANLLGDVAVAGALGVKPLDLLSVVSGAQAGQQALDNGESYDRAGLAAVGSGLITREIESMGGYFGDWGGKAAKSLAKTDIGKKVLSKIPQSAANWIAKAADTWLGRKATGALSEGVEEFTEYYAQGFFNNLLLDKDTPLSIKEALYNAGLGTAIGLGAGGSNKAILENAATQPVTQEAVQAETAQPNTAEPVQQTLADRVGEVFLNKIEGVKKFIAPHEQPISEFRQVTDSVINHLGEEGAFNNIKRLLEESYEERKARDKEKGAVATIATPEDLKPRRKNLQDLTEGFYRKMVDSGHRVDQIAKEIKDDTLYPLFNNAKQARNAAQYNIGVAQTNLNGETIGKSAKDIINPIKAKGDVYWNAFQHYIYHMHNIDSMTLKQRGAALLYEQQQALAESNPVLKDKTEKQIKELKKDPQFRDVAERWLSLSRRSNAIKNKPVFGRDVTAEISQEQVDKILMAFPEIEADAAEVFEYYKKMLDNDVAAGLISPYERSVLNELYPHYVPVMTTTPTIAAERRKGVARVEDVHKSRTANSRMLLPIDEAMARKTLSSIAAQKRNLFGTRLLESALVNPNKTGRDVLNIDDTDMAYDIDAEEAPDLKNKFVVWVDGQKVDMAVSPELMEGIRSVIPDGFDGNAITEFMGKANNAFKKAVTSHNPFFAITNTIKDLQDAAFYTDQNLKKFFENYGKAYKEMLSNGDMWQLYQAMGGTGNSYFNYGEGIKLPEDKSGVKGKLSTIKEKVEAINLITEQAPRLSEFISVIEKGGRSYENIQKALLAAADITTNFGRSGELGQKINRTAVPFFNPGVQGADKLRRHIQNNITNKEWASLIGRASLVGILPSLLNYLMWKDDEEYNLLPDHVKDNYYVFKGNDGIWYRIPKGRATMPIGNAAQRAGRAMQGEEGAFEGYLKSSLDAVAPNNPFTDNLAAPIIQAANNKAWHGGTIEPQRLQKLEEGQRYDEKTDKLSKLIGGATNTSPKKINYVLDQYSGVYGDVLLPLMTPQAEGVPLVNRFYTDTVTSNRLANDFYNSLEKAEQAFNTNYNPIDKAEYSALNKAAKTLSEYYAKDREINASDMKDSEKRNQSRELAKERNDFLLKALEEAQAARETAGKTFSGISDADYALAYIAQKEFTKSKDKKAAVDKAVPHLPMAQKQTLYQAFNIAKSAW